MTPDVAAIEANPWPDVDQYDFTGLRDRAHPWQRQYAVRGPYWVSKPLFCTTCGLMGMEAALLKMLAEPDAVRAEVTRVITAQGGGGGYICGPDHHLKPDVSRASALALFDQAAGFRRPGYTA